MKTTDFHIKAKAKTLNESLSRKFGEKLDIDNYSTEQLQRVSDLIETKIGYLKNSKFNETLENEEFYRLTMMQDVVRTALSERAVSKSQQQAAGAALAAKRGDAPKSKLKGSSKEMMKMSTKELEKFAGTKHKGLPKKVDEASKPDFLDMDKDGNKKEPMKKALKDKENKKVNELGPKTLGSYVTKVAKLEPHQVKPSREAGIEKATKLLRKKEREGEKIEEGDAPRFPITGNAPKGSAERKRKAVQMALGRKNKDHPDWNPRINPQTAALRLGRKLQKSATNESWDDEWVNSNRPNFKGSMADTEQLVKLFKKKGHTITDVDDSADPVLVLMSGDTPVGWYDFENEFGYMEKNPNPAKVYETKVKKKHASKKKSMNESYIAIGRYLLEGEEGKAELIMAVKDMVDKFTGWSEDIAQMQAQTAMEMADAIRDEMGSDSAEQFTAGVQPALDAAFQAVKSAREALNNQVGTLTGNAPEPMGPEPEADMGDEELPATSDEELPPEPEADETPPEGREKRESIERRNRLTKLLASR